MPYFHPRSVVEVTTEDGSRRVRLRPTGVRIQSSRTRPVDLAKVTLPLHEKLDLETFAKGDEIEIRLAGVNDEEPVTEFKGYVTGVGPNLPVVLHCADAAWFLGRKYFDEPKVWREPKFDDVVSELCIGAGLPGLITDTSVVGGLGDGGRLTADAESYLARIVQIASYDFRTDFCIIPGTKTPYYGISQQPELIYGQTEVPILRFDRMVVESKLEYRQGDRVGKVVVHSWDERWEEESDIIAEYGDGEPVEHVKERVEDEEEAARRAKEIYQQLNKSGYTGTLTVFGMSFLRHSCVVKLMDERYPYRTGRYYLDGVETRYENGTYRKKLTVGPAFPVPWRETA